MVTVNKDFIIRLESWNYYVQHNKCTNKLLISWFHWNGHTFRFSPQKKTMQPFDMNVDLTLEAKWYNGRNNGTQIACN